MINTEIRLEVNTACQPFRKADYVVAQDAVRSGRGASPVSLPLRPPGRPFLSQDEQEAQRPFWSWVAQQHGLSPAQDLLQRRILRRVPALWRCECDKKSTAKAILEPEQLTSRSIELVAVWYASRGGLSRFGAPGVSTRAATRIFSWHVIMSFRHASVLVSELGRGKICRGQDSQSALLEALSSFNRWADLLEGEEEDANTADLKDVIVTVIDGQDQVLCGSRSPPQLMHAVFVQEDSDEYDTEWTSVEMLAFHAEENHDKSQTTQRRHQIRQRRIIIQGRNVTPDMVTTFPHFP